MSKQKKEKKAIDPGMKETLETYSYRPQGALGGVPYIPREVCSIGSDYLFPQTTAGRLRFSFWLLATIVLLSSTALTSWGVYHEVEEKDNINGYGLITLIMFFLAGSIFSIMRLTETVYPCNEFTSAP